MSKKNKQKNAAKNGKLKGQPNLSPSANSPLGSAGPVVTEPGGNAVTSPPADVPLTKPILSGAFPPRARLAAQRGPLPFGKGDVRGFIGKPNITAPAARGLRLRPL